MIGKFSLFNGLTAGLLNEGSTVIFSPYNLSVGILKRHKDIDLNKYLRDCEKLSCFGIPSNQGPSLPDNFDLTLLITNDCNLRCKYCFASGGEKKDYMSTDIALNIVNKVFHMTGRKNIKVSFFGGEPTLNFDVINGVVSHVKTIASSLNKDYSFYITTNGVMSRRILEFLADNDFVFVISSDGIPTLHNFLRPTSSGSHSSKYVENTIDILVKRNIPFKVRSTISQFNVDYMTENVRYFAGLGVKIIHYEPITHAGRGKSNDTTLERAEIDKYINNFTTALDVAKEYNVSIISSSYMNFLAPAQKFCDAMAGSRLVGSYNGDITLCVEVQDACHPYSSNAIVGNTNEKTGQMYFDYNKYDRVLKNVTIEQNPDCKQCFAKFSCGGGCPVKNFYSSDCKMVDNYRCNLTKGIVGNILERIYQESVVDSNLLYKSNSITLYRMRIPQEIWMKRKVSKISNVLAEIIIDNEIMV